MEYFRQRNAECYCSMDKMDSLEVKVQGRCNKIFSLSQHPACWKYHRKNTFQRLSTLGLILRILSTLCQTFLPDHLAGHPCIIPACVHGVLYSSLCLHSSKELAENGGQFSMCMKHEYCFRRGFYIQRMFVKIECIERIANSLKVKLSMQKISVARASKKKK